MPPSTLSTAGVWASLSVMRDDGSGDCTAAAGIDAVSTMELDASMVNSRRKVTDLEEPGRAIVNPKAREHPPRTFLILSRRPQLTCGGLLLCTPSFCNWRSSAP